MEPRIPNKKEVGLASHGLRAHIKALELAQGVRISTYEFRYEISADRQTARIIRSADGTEIEGTMRPVSAWAAVGRKARLGLIGLRAAKEELHGTGKNVQYSLNALTGEATLTCNGTTLEDQPKTIDAWAQKGSEVEQRLFESLRGANEFGCSTAADKVREEMLRLGVIRERRSGEDAAENPGA